MGHILGKDSGYIEDVTTGCRSTFRRGSVSLPRVGAGAVELADCLPPDARHMLTGERGTLLQDVSSCSEDWRKLSFDPVLARKPAVYGRLLADLLARKIVEMGEADVLATPFLVAKI